MPWVAKSPRVSRASLLILIQTSGIPCYFASYLQSFLSSSSFSSLYRPPLFSVSRFRLSWILDSVLPRNIVCTFLNLWISNMKYLEFTPLDSINMFLDDLNLGESTIKGKLEAYSCKQTSMDRKLSLSLEHEILDYLSQSADSDPSSPVEYLSRRSSRRTLIYLVLTLGHMYPDYDFSAVQAHLFFREEECDSIRQIFDTYLFEAVKEWFQLNGGSLLESMSKAIDEVIKLDECEIYSYNPDFDGDPSFEKGAIWSFNFFFYNKKLKRIVSFRCCCLSNLVIDGLPDEEMLEDEGEDEGLFIDMDM